MRIALKRRKHKGSHFHGIIKGGSPYHDALQRHAKTLIFDALRVHNGNLTHAARALGLQRTYLYVLLRRFGRVD